MASADLMMSIDANLKQPTAREAAQSRTTSSAIAADPTTSNNNNNNKQPTKLLSTPPPSPTAGAASTVQMLNPFVHKLELVTLAEKIQVSESLRALDHT